MTDDPVIAVDRFPVDVIKSDGTMLHQVRLVLTQPQNGVGELKVWTAPDVLALDTSFTLADSNIGSRQMDWGIQTPQGVVAIRSSGGCGCGNRLKYWQPYTPMRMGRLR